jgi:PII-like signaling protein
MIIVRIYLREADLGYHKELLQETMYILHDSHRVHGVTLSYGIAGFERHGEIHSVDLLRLNVHPQSAQTGLAAREWECGTLCSHSW